MGRYLLLLIAGVASAQDFSNIMVERVVKGLRYADGPVWSYDGFLLFSDSAADQLRKLTPGTPDVEFGERPGGAMGNAYDTDGRLYSCEFRQRRVTRIGKNGKTEILAARFEGKRLNAPNDIIVRRDGHVYFTDPAFGAAEDARELDFNGIYHMTPRGDLEAIARWKTRPNGVALSPNGRTLYVTDSDRRELHAFDLDGKGAATRERVIAEKIPGVPNGIKTDENGNVYVAAKGIYVYAPSANGLAKRIGEVPLGETPSNLAFGDPDRETLYITARTGVYRVRLGVKGALAY